MKIHLENLIANSANNNREIDTAHVMRLAESIARYGLLTSLTVRKAAKIDGVQQFTVMAGFHRELAIKKLQGLSDAQVRALGTHKVDGKIIPGRTIDELFPEGRIDVVVIDSDAAEAAVTVENTARKDYTQPELCTIVWELDDLSVDQHEIAARCTMNQGRVSEFLALRKAIPQAHDAWIEGHVTMRDMLALAALPEAKQLEHLEKLASGGGSGSGGEADAGAANPGRRAKAAARKELQGAAKETRRSYANAGKPSRKRLTVLSERISSVVKTGTDAEKNLFKIIDQAFAFVDGRIDEKSFKKWLQTYEVADIFTDPEGTKPEKPAKASKSKAEEPKAEKPANVEEPVKAKKAKAEKPVKPVKAKKAKAEKAKAEEAKAEKPAKKAAKKSAKKAAKKAAKKPAKKAK